MKPPSSSPILRREHLALAEFLIALAGFDRERRWVALGYPRLFEFLRRELKLSAGAAQYRKTAAGLIQAYPTVEAALRSGDLCLSSVIELAKVITAENAAEVVPVFFGKSARDAAFVAAALRPVEDPPRRAFLVTSVAATAASEPGSSLAALGAEASRCDPAATDAFTFGAFRTSEVDFGGSRDGGRSPALPSAGVVDAAHPPAAVFGPSSRAPALTSTAPDLVIQPAPERPRVRPLDVERARVSMTVSRRLLEKLAAARDALSHSHPNASEEAIFELGLDLIIERHRKRRGIGAKPRKPIRAPEAPAAIEAPGSSSSSQSSPPPLLPPPVPPPTARSRHVPAAVWRGVWERDAGRCAWRLQNGGVCGSTHRLQLDHVEGFARGAATTIDGCRLLCAFHQDVSARELYGDAVMNGFTRPKHRDRCSEPVASYGPA